MKKKNVQLEALMDSKKEYLDHLFDLVTEPMIVTFQDMYQECLNDPQTRKKGILNAFQDALTGIASWNHHLIKEHYEQMVAHTGCKYLPELIRALINVQVKINLIANSKMLTANNIKLKIPSAENFIHRFYVDVARGIWKRPYLLYHNVRSVEKQQNILELEKLIQQTVRMTLRGYVPMEQLIAMNLDDEVPQPTSHTKSESDTSESETESETSESETETEADSEDDDISDVESVVEVVELPTEPEEEELQNEVYNPIHEVAAEVPENEPEIVADDVTEVIQDVATFQVNEDNNEEPTTDIAFDLAQEAEPDITVIHESEDEVVEKKNVEYRDVNEEEPVSPQVHLNKVPEDEPVVAPAPVEAVADDRTTPFNMMIMNRKIITHRPPTTMVLKKKKKDAFF